MAGGQWEGGKGSAYRPVNQKQYDENHRRIFGESKLEKMLREQAEQKNDDKKSRL